MVAAELTQQANDLQQLVPMLAAIGTTLAAAGIDDPLQRLAADSGYWSIANVSAIPGAPELLIPPARHGRQGMWSIESTSSRPKSLYQHHPTSEDPRSSTVTTSDWTTGVHGNGQYAEVNGINLYFETHGAGRPMLLLHGGLGSGEMFGPVLATLAEGHQVIAVDLQGHGRTADIDRPLDVRLMADDIAALIDHLGLGRPDLLGYSLGGWVALHTAAKCPAKVAGWWRPRPTSAPTLSSSVAIEDALLVVVRSSPALPRPWRTGPSTPGQSA